MLSFVEVAPRDGLQNIKGIWPTEDKLALIRQLIASGAKRLEVASFVHPRLVPQMADAEAVAAGLGQIEGVSRIGLVLNKRGALRALATDLDEIGIVCAASDTFGMNNQNMTSAESVEEAVQILNLCNQQERKAQVTIAVAFHCPFEGAVNPNIVVEIARTLASAGPLEIALADTIGAATPAEVEKLVAAVREEAAPMPVRVHFHDTQGMGVANCWAAYRAGAQIFDASVAGLGGCPFAPGAAGNVASENVEYLFQQAGISLGLDRAKLEDTAQWTKSCLVKNAELIPAQ